MGTSNTDLHELLFNVGLLKLYHNVLQYFRLGNTETCSLESLYNSRNKKVFCRSTKFRKIKVLGSFLFESCANDLCYLSKKFVLKTIFHILYLV